MYKNIYLLKKEFCSYNEDDCIKLQDRWNDESENAMSPYDYVIKKIKEGGGKGFCQELLSFSEFPGDLRGIFLEAIAVNGPKSDNIRQNIDFSYSKFNNCTFENFSFGSVFNFVEFSNCKFNNCQFNYARYNNCFFKECEFNTCSFINNSIFFNCRFDKSKFKEYFFYGRLFEECVFDINVEIGEPLYKHNDFKQPMDKKDLISHYVSLQNAYKAGGAKEKARECYYYGCVTKTKFGCGSKKEYCYRIFLQVLAGYGVKPFRAIYVGIGIIFMFTIIFTWADCFFKAFLMSLSAFLNMGDATSLVWPYDILYLLEGFLGFSILGIYITTLANKWFSE